MAVEFWAALAGAAVGGGASLAGSVIVNRREVTRSARLRLHDELLPELEESLAYSDESFRRQLGACRRAAVLSGGQALGYIAAIEAAFDVLAFTDETNREAYRESRLHVLVEIGMLQEWVEGKIL